MGFGSVKSESANVASKQRVEKMSESEAHLYARAVRQLEHLVLRNRATRQKLERKVKAGQIASMGLN